MKGVIISAIAMLSLFIGCKQNPENGGEEIRDGEQRSDTPMTISNYPNEGADDSSGSNGQGIRQYPGSNATPGKRTFEGTREDSQKTKANPLYKGDNSDTNKKPR